MDWEWLRNLLGDLSPSQVRFLVRHLPRGTIIKLWDIRPQTAVEAYQDALAQCRAEIAKAYTIHNSELRTVRAQYEARLEEANKQRETELDNLKLGLNKLLSDHHWINFNYARFSLLTAEYREDENAKRLLAEHVSPFERNLYGITTVSDSLKSHRIISGERPDGRFIMLFTFNETVSTVVQLHQPGRLLAELRKLALVQEIIDNNELLFVVQRTIRYYEKEESAGS